MTGPEITQARHDLAKRWGLDSPLTLSEMARCLKLTGRDPNASMRDFERRAEVSGPMEVAITGLMAMDEPPAWAEIFED